MRYSPEIVTAPQPMMPSEEQSVIAALGPLADPGSFQAGPVANRISSSLGSIPMFNLRFQGRPLSVSLEHHLLLQRIGFVVFRLNLPDQFLSLRTGPGAESGGVVQGWSGDAAFDGRMLSYCTNQEVLRAFLDPEVRSNLVQTLVVHGSMLERHRGAFIFRVATENAAQLNTETLRRWCGLAIWLADRTVSAFQAVEARVGYLGGPQQAAQWQMNQAAAGQTSGMDPAVKKVIIWFAIGVVTLHVLGFAAWALRVYLFLR
jgi:hypothetical protein